MRIDFYSVMNVRELQEDKELIKEILLNRSFQFDIGQMMEISHAVSRNRGWYKNPDTGEEIERNVPEMIALMHSELSEALEAFRKNLIDDKLPNRLGIAVEFADLLHRLFDTAAYLNLQDLPHAYVEKALFNLDREDHSLEKRKGEHGKKF